MVKKDFFDATLLELSYTLKLAINNFIPKYITAMNEYSDEYESEETREHLLQIVNRGDMLVQELVGGANAIDEMVRKHDLDEDVANSIKNDILSVYEPISVFDTDLNIVTSDVKYERSIHADEMEGLVNEVKDEFSEVLRAILFTVEHVK